MHKVNKGFYVGIFLAGGRELLPENPRVRRGYVIGFLDGHVELVRPDRLDELIWTPGTQPLLDDR